MTAARKGWDLWTSKGPLLRGASIFQQEINGSPWCSKATQQDFDALRRAGANFVDLSVPGTFSVDPPYGKNVAFLDEVTRLVSLARNSNLYVVVSLRTGPGRGEEDITGDQKTPRRSLFTDHAPQQKFIEMWSALGSTFKDATHVIGYDVLVEPHRSSAEAPTQFRHRWRFLARNVVHALRSVDPHTPILVSPDEWGVPSALASWEPMFHPQAESAMRIVYTVHQYEPYAYTHDDSASGDPAFDPSFSALTTAFRQISAFRDKFHVPVTVNEFGVKFRRPQAERFLAQEIALLEKLKANHSIWIWELIEGTCADGEFGVNDPSAAPLLAVLADNWRKNCIHPS